MTEILIVELEEWPHGLRCMDCDEKLINGSAYSKRLVALDVDGDPVVELVCVPCALALVAESPCSRCGSYGHFTHNHPDES